MNGASGPSATSITVTETLELLEGPFAAVARGLANGRYALWLGSGISLERTPDLRQLILKVLEFLHERMTDDADCPHRKALEDAVEMAGLRPGERAQFELKDDPGGWPVRDLVLEGLRSKYSEFLDIRVAGEEADYLLWDGVDVRDTYGSQANPDCEHLCLGILVLEGALTNAASANWDGLIEAALDELAGDSMAIVRRVVLPPELRDPPRALTLLKFHGCAVSAKREPNKYRSALVATLPQITGWNTDPETKPLCDRMVGVATTEPTLMIGLSAQDRNIQQVFAQARADMKWSWPADPPAHVFADDELGREHINLLRVVYRDDYDANAQDIENQALIRAYGKPLLTALMLFALTAKLQAYLGEAEMPSLAPVDVQQLQQGLSALCHTLADAAEPDRLAFVKEFATAQLRALTLFQEGSEPRAGRPSYRPLGTLPPDRVGTDPALQTSGIRELAVGLALLGRGGAASTWSVSIGPVGSGTEGVLKVSSRSSETAVFFAANGRAGVELQAKVVDPTAADVVILNSTEPAERLTRSPGGLYGRTGSPALREVDMSELLRTAPDLTALDENFRQAAAL